VRTTKLGTALAVVCLGAGAWLVARPKEPEVERPAQGAPPPQSSKHGGKVHFDVLAKLLADDRRSAAKDGWWRELADPRVTLRVETQSHPLLHRAAPRFTLRDHRAQPWSLKKQLAQGPVVLVFYLGYACNACVHDLFELDADRERIHSLGAEVLAVSGDAPDLTRRRFEEYGAFGFPVLFDPGHGVAQFYGVFRPAKGSEGEQLRHGTFLIGRDGQVHWVHTGDAPFRNNKALLYELARLGNKLPQPDLAAKEGAKEPKTR
jgi:peroxiredoxin